MNFLQHLSIIVIRVILLRMIEAMYVFARVACALYAYFLIISTYTTHLCLPLRILSVSEI